MLVLSCKLGGVRGLFCKIASTRGLSPTRAVFAWADVRVGRICGPLGERARRVAQVVRVDRAGDSLFLFSKELEIVF